MLKFKNFAQKSTRNVEICTVSEKVGGKFPYPPPPSTHQVRDFFGVFLNWDFFKKDDNYSFLKPRFAF